MDTTKRIPLFRSYLTAKDIAEGERVLRRNRNLSKGDEIVEFERALAEYVGRKYCVVVNSGCGALEIALYLTGKVPLLISPFTYHGVFKVLDRLNVNYNKGSIETETYVTTTIGYLKQRKLANIYVSQISNRVWNISFI